MASTFAERLKIFRESTRLSQLDFGERCNLSQKMISNLESGRTKKISNDYYNQIESAFKNVSPKWLRLGLGEMERESSRQTPTSEATSTLSGDTEQIQPSMTGAINVDDMTPEQQATFFRLRSERFERKLAAAEKRLAEYEQAEDEQRAFQLVGSSGGRSFTDASLDAAAPTELAEMQISYVAPDWQRFVAPERAAPERMVVYGFGANS